MSSPRILYIADTDSQLRPAWLMAKAIQRAVGGTLDGNLIPSRNQASEAQRVTAGVPKPTHRLSLRELLPFILVKYDIVVAMLPGSKLYGLRRALEAVVGATAKKRPLLVTGYNGIIYEKHTEGLLWRTGYDAIFVNSEADLQRFSGTLANLGLPSSSLVPSGPPLVQDTLENSNLTDQTASPGAPIKSLLFATQAVQPAQKGDRLYLLSQLHKYALRYPLRQVIIKPRTRPDETTFHVEKYHYEALYEEAYPNQKPVNLTFSYGALKDYFTTVNLFIGVSSTAIMEALAAGKRAAILTDLGVAESLGNQFFVGSGLLCSMLELREDRIPVLDARWAKLNGLEPSAGGSEVLAAHFNPLLQSSSSGGLSWARCYYGPSVGTAIHEAWLESPLNPVRTSLGDQLRSTLTPSPKRSRRHAKLRKLYRHPVRFFTDAGRNAIKARRTTR